MIRRLLIANRGEIAVRIARACRELDVESVAIFSDVDATARHVLAADRAVPIGGTTPAESYLSISAIVEAARRSGADAVHPGYGFLAENPSFAAACEGAGLVFVGPPSDVIARMASKIAARALMTAAGVPVVPGETPMDQSDTGVIEAARRLGLPALLKASAGGGGKGMRVVREPKELTSSIQAARREALAAFGDGTLYVERLLDRARHVEFQIFGDARGRVVHLFERECSMQRRHQKIIEESPSLALTPRLRQRMGDAAVAAARAADYRNAGTVEFLVEGRGDEARFYFLEMNTRLQVEHPVTEMVTGLDLVRAQLLVAGGEPLAWSEDHLQQRGHAIECRIYAEDPTADFLPQAGRLLLYREPPGPGIRVDSGVAEGDEVTVHYDPLLAKAIAYGEDRDAAVRRARAALRAYPILGVRTNIAFLVRLLAHPRFASGDIDTTFIEQELAASPGALGDDLTDIPAAALAAAAVHSISPRGIGTDRTSVDADPWTVLPGWRQRA